MKPYTKKTSDTSCAERFQPGQAQPGEVVCKWCNGTGYCGPAVCSCYMAKQTKPAGLVRLDCDDLEYRATATDTLDSRQEAANQRYLLVALVVFIGLEIAAAFCIVQLIDVLIER